MILVHYQVYLIYKWKVYKLQHIKDLGMINKIILQNGLKSKSQIRNCTADTQTPSENAKTWQQKALTTSSVPVCCLRNHLHGTILTTGHGSACGTDRCTSGTWCPGRAASDTCHKRPAWKTSYASVQTKEQVSANERNKCTNLRYLYWSLCQVWHAQHSHDPSSWQTCLCITIVMVMTTCIIYCN